MSVLGQAAIFLGAAVVAVPLSKRLGLGAVLGYLAAGVAIGPWGLGLVRNVDDTLHFAELGVVLLLFIIGLELQPSRLWALRKSVFGLGGAQVLVTGALLASAGYVFGLALGTAVVVGLGLSLSSTAFALQILAEKKQLTTRHGRSAFSILLFQDLAVIPLLALLPLLSPADGGSPDGGTVFAVLKVIVVLTAVVVGGRYFLRHALRLIAATGIHEVNTATTLLTVIGTALLMELVGLSMALGAFLAGVLLADSEYRHALEADIEPFKGLLLGLFFIAVGMSVNVGLIGQVPLLVAALVAGLVTTKFIVLFVLGKLYGHNNTTARNLAFSISQGGEFAFVIFGVAVSYKLMGRDLSELLIVVVTLSMAVTPLLFAFNETLLRKWLAGPKEEHYEDPVNEENQVIIAGYGRFGQIVSRVLRAKKIGFTALEISPEQVDFVRRFGNKIYYGDASRLDLLRAANADKARIFVLAIDGVEASLRTAEIVTQHFPNLTIYARARNRKHAYQLMDLGTTTIRRETFLASVDMARLVLEGMGLSHRESEETVKAFKEYDVKRLFAHQSSHNDEQKMIDLAKQAAKELEELFEQDAQEDAAAS